MKYFSGLFAFLALTTAVAQAQVRPCAATGPGFCAGCVGQSMVLESGRPPLPGEEGDGIQACLILNAAEEWDDFCTSNAVPNWPVLDEAFFAERSVVAVIIHTLTPRLCEGSLDPVWRLNCIVPNPRRVATRVVLQTPGNDCRCSAMPQMEQRLFLAAAVAKTDSPLCRVCEEGHAIDCVR